MLLPHLACSARSNCSTSKLSAATKAGLAPGPAGPAAAAGARARRRRSRPILGSVTEMLDEASRGHSADRCLGGRGETSTPTALAATPARGRPGVLIPRVVVTILTVASSAPPTVGLLPFNLFNLFNLVGLVVLGSAGRSEGNGSDSESRLDTRVSVRRTIIVP